MTVIQMIGTKGGVGTSLLAVGLAQRLALRGPVLLVDGGRLVGTDDLLLDVVAERSWADLVRLAAELSARHIQAVAVGDHLGLRLVGAPSSPGPPISPAVIRALASQIDCLIVDGPPAAEALAAGLPEACDRLLLIATPDPPALRGVTRVLAGLQPHVQQRAKLVLNQWSDAIPASPEALASGCGLALLATIPVADQAVFGQVQFGRIDGRASAWSGAIDALADRLAVPSERQADGL